VQRREFIKLSSIGTCAIASGVSLGRGPIERSGPSRFQIGLAAYSLRNYFSWNKGKPKTPADDGPAMDMSAFVNYCAAQGFDTAELTSYFFDPEAGDDYFRGLKHQAFVSGITISGTAIGNNFTIGKGPRLDAEIAQAKVWIDRAAVLGAPHIRFFAGTGRQLADDPQRLIEASEALNQCARHAAKKGIFLGVENHGGLTADQMIQIMERAESPWVGINLDTGNFLSEDPYADLQQCVKYAVNVQVKVGMKSPSGKTYPADMNRIAKILKDGGYQGFVILEYEDKDPYENIPQAFAKLKDALS
jgi:sugar phosphate isomerase/epimerase